VTHTNLPQHRALTVCFYLTGIIAVAIYGSVVYRHAYNIPKWDDFPDILLFLDRWLAANSIAEKLSVLVAQTNEHILLVNHLVILCQYYAIGHLDFAWLIYIGNLFYLGSSLTLWSFYRGSTHRAFCFAIVMLTGVSFYPCESTLWAMTALSNQAVIFFSLLAIYTITRKSASLLLAMLLAMLLAVLAVFSQSNGLLVLPVIAVYLASAKARNKLLAWCLLSAGLVALYLHWFNPESQRDTSLLSVLHQLPWLNFALTIPTFFASFGSALFTQADVLSNVMAFLIGSAIFGILCLQASRRQYELPVALALGFLLLSILSLAAYRGLTGGLAVAFVSRYKMYAAYILGAGVLLGPLLQEKIRASLRWQLFILSVAIIFFAWSFPANLPQSRLIDSDLHGSLQRWVEDGDLRRARGFFVPDADSYLFTAVENGTYSPLALIPDKQILHNVQVLESCPVPETIPAMGDNESPLKIVHKNPNAIAIKVIVHPDALHVSAPLVVTLCSEQHNYQFSVPSLAAHPLSATEVKDPVFYIPREKIAAGKYSVLLAIDHQPFVPNGLFVNKPATR
jgi:hypothetical protein